MNLETLNSEFRIEERIRFSELESGLAVAELKTASGQQCQISLFGAHLLSWKDSKGQELLFLSEKADLSGKNPIRGGVPLVFPQFGVGTLPPHGFTRTANWKVIDRNVDNSGPNSVGTVSLTLQLESDSNTRALWPHEFKVQYEIELGASLKTRFAVLNCGKSDFEFQSALHTYFRVGNIEQVQVLGLAGLDYLDSTRARARANETRDMITFTGETDRIYLNAPNRIEIADSSMGRKLTISTENFRDAVVWNPWVERCKAIADLNDHDFQNFVCVESGNVAEAVRLKAGQEFVGRQEITVF